jgi:hemerythrin
MIAVEWDKKFEVGHERIDFEHKIFLNLIRKASWRPGTSHQTGADFVAPKRGEAIRGVSVHQ